LQFDFLLGQAQLGQSHQKDPQAAQTELQSLQEKFQKEYQALVSDPEPVKRVAEAYTQYVDAVRKSFTDLDPKKMDPVSLAMAAQSLLSVSYTAEQARHCWQNMAAQDEADDVIGFRTETA
jgi:hypothetical protein